MEHSYIVILITAPSKAVGEQIAQRLLQEKLVACVNMVPEVNSLYTWQGELCNDEEVLLIAKSRLDLFASRIVPAVKAVHPYDVPEIIALPIIAGSAEYLGWIQEVTG